MHSAGNDTETAEIYNSRNVRTCRIEQCKAYLIRTKSSPQSTLVDGEGLALEALICTYHGMHQLRNWDCNYIQTS